ncbi:DMT family transporter [Sulfurospirillum arcachonense]|uniref:DMT family transporter n=1 Tax=Sulfurospirillum arcachonense TaxID=57666 RepID=UPI00046A9367|nr:DMT family transporter [Sulfurospirillum arcachonense]
MIKSKLKEFGADFSLLLVAICWGGTFFIVQDAIEGTPVYIFLFWRFFIATILMGLLSFKEIKKLDKPTLKAGFVLGVFMFLGFAFQTFGLSYTYSSTVAFITGLNVVIVPFAVFLIFKKKASIYSLFGAVCAVVGLYFLTNNETLGGFSYGEFYSLICAAMFALQITFTDVYAKKYSAFLLVTIQFAVVSMLSFFGAIALDGHIQPKSFDGVFLEAIIITVLFATIFAFFTQTVMQKFTTPAKTAIIFTMEPVSAGIFGYYFAGEEFHAVQLMGAGLILFGMLSAELGTYFRNKRLANV